MTPPTQACATCGSTSAKRYYGVRTGVLTCRKCYNRAYRKRAQKREGRHRTYDLWGVL